MKANAMPSSNTTLRVNMPTTMVAAQMPTPVRKASGLRHARAIGRGQAHETGAHRRAVVDAFARIGFGAGHAATSPFQNWK
jgi:hypothetical protein